MTTKFKRGFASDNNSGVHPTIMQAILKANEGHVVAYGDDPYTESQDCKKSPFSMSGTIKIPL